MLASAVNYFAFVAPDKALPGELAAAHQSVLAIAQDDAARRLAQRVVDNGEAALDAKDSDAARKAIAQLTQLEKQLAQAYVIQVVNRPDARSGVWRIPDVNQDARNYYLIVEAIDASGERLSVPVTSEESGDTDVVTSWGLRVDEGTFDAVRRDKQDDGIIENDRVGYKKRGHLEPDYEMPTSGGAITRW